MNRAGQLKTCERITRYMCTTFSALSIFFAYQIMCLCERMWTSVWSVTAMTCCNGTWRSMRRWSLIGQVEGWPRWRVATFIRKITSLLNEGGTHFGWGIICLSIPVEHGFTCLEEVFCLSHMANWFRSSLSTFTGSPSLFQRKYIPYITSYGKLTFSLCSCSDITTWFALLLLPCYVTHQNPLDLCSMALLTILKGSHLWVINIYRRFPWYRRHTWSASIKVYEGVHPSILFFIQMNILTRMILPRTKFRMEDMMRKHD